MPLNDIVNVVITRQTQQVTEAGFGIPLILGTNVNFTDRIRFYSSMDEVAVDFAPNTKEYVASQDIFSQEISPDRIAIGRRQVDSLDVVINTATTGATYQVFANNQVINFNATSANTYSIATLNNDLILNNRINLTVNGTGIGTVTSVINFNIDFVTLNSIVATINAVPIVSVPFNTNQATTLADLATALQATVDIVTATVTGARQITAVFANIGTNTINSVVTTLGATQPTATVAQGGFLFTVDTATTMQNIANQIIVQFPTYTATVSPTPSRILTVQGPNAVTATFNNFTVTGGVSQATATIVNPQQPVTKLSVRDGIVGLINANIAFPVTALGISSDTFTINNKINGTPFTFRVSTNITNPNSANVLVTQIIPNTSYVVTINGVEFSYTTENEVQNANQIIQKLVDQINLIPQQVVINATNNLDGSMTINSINTINNFSLSVSTEIMSIEKGLSVSTLNSANAVAVDLNAIENVNSEWYALISTNRDVPTVLAIANWVESRHKIFGTASDDLAIINVQAGVDVTSIAAVLNQGGYVRTFVMYHQDASLDYPEAAWFGRVLPLIPGSETWAFKRLNTVSYSNLTTTQINNALNKKANIYTFVAGVGITQDGTMAQGEYIDIVRGIDWLTARIQEGVFSLLVNNNKIPYTDGGIATVQAEVLRVLQLGVDNDLLAENPIPTVTVPLAINVPNVDKANRILRNVRFQATLSGAIHAVNIIGNISI